MLYNDVLLPAGRFPALVSCTNNETGTELGPL